MTAAENDADDTLSEDEIVELLRDTLLDASVRFDRLEEELSGTDTDVFDALVALATTDDHVLLAPETRYRKFTTLCSTAADRGHDVSTEDVLRASIDEYDRTETLSEDIRSLSTLSESEIDDRLSMLDEITGSTDRDSLGQTADDEGDGDTRVAASGRADASTPDGSQGGRASVPIETGKSMTDLSEPATDEETDEPVTTSPDDRHQGAADPPQQTDPTEQGSLSMPNYAQDLVDFEFVMDDDESYLPAGVSGSGIVVTNEDEYVGIIQIKPRTWSIHTDAKKSEIIGGYKSAFLATLDFPIQIVSYPTKFDISDHVSRLEEVATATESRPDDTTLVTLGRNLYPNWLERFILDNDMKQRQVYVVVPITADQLSEFQTGTDGFLDTLADKAPPLAPIAEKLSTGSGGQDVSREQCVRELRSRLSHIESGLRRFDVGAERLTDRDEVMSVIYHYYNNEQPMNEVFPTGPYSVADNSTHRE